MQVRSCSCTTQGPPRLITCSGRRRRWLLRVCDEPLHGSLDAVHGNAPERLIHARLQRASAMRSGSASAA